MREHGQAKHHTPGRDGQATHLTLGRDTDHQGFSYPRRLEVVLETNPLTFVIKRGSSCILLRGSS
jgi:hypothetical protein